MLESIDRFVSCSTRLYCWLWKLVECHQRPVENVINQRCCHFINGREASHEPDADLSRLRKSAAARCAGRSVNG